MELRQHRSVDFVGLDLRPGNGSNQDRIGDDDPTDEGREQTDNHIRIAGRLDDDLVIGLERLGELQQATVFEIYPSRIPDFTIFQNGHLSESPMDVESNDSHFPAPSRFQRPTGAGGLTRQLPIRARSAIGQVEGGGQITTRALSSQLLSPSPPYVPPTPQPR